MRRNGHHHEACSLAVFLGLATAITVLVISVAYGQVIERFIFVSVAVLDSGGFKGDEIERLEEERQAALDEYVALARRLGWNAEARFGVGLDADEGVTKMCIQIAREYPPKPKPAA